jgi:hypothetical protein
MGICRKSHRTLARSARVDSAPLETTGNHSVRDRKPINSLSDRRRCSFQFQTATHLIRSVAADIQQVDAPRDSPGSRVRSCECRRPVRSNRRAPKCLARRDPGTPSAGDRLPYLRTKGQSGARTDPTTRRESAAQEGYGEQERKRGTRARSPDGRAIGARYRDHWTIGGRECQQCTGRRAAHEDVEIGRSWKRRMRT